jgi:hypothetical protein
MNVMIGRFAMRARLLIWPVLLSSVLVPACVVHVPVAPPPPQISRDEAVERAFDFAQRNGYKRVSVRSAGRDGAAWDVHLRVERPFPGKLLVFLDAFTGEILRADVFRDRIRRHEHDREHDDDNEDGGRGRGREGRDDGD